jgi:hypothetical protein
VESSGSGGGRPSATGPNSPLTSPTHDPVPGRMWLQGPLHLRGTLRPKERDWPNLPVKLVSSSPL